MTNSNFANLQQQKKTQPIDTKINLVLLLLTRLSEKMSNRLFVDTTKRLVGFSMKL